MALTGDGASELSLPSCVSFSFLPLYWPMKEPSSLNCPSPPSPLSSLSSRRTVPLDGVRLPFSGLWSSVSLQRVRGENVTEETNGGEPDSTMDSDGEVVEAVRLQAWQTSLATIPTERQHLLLLLCVLCVLHAALTLVRMPVSFGARIRFLGALTQKGAAVDDKKGRRKDLRENDNKYILCLSFMRYSPPSPSFTSETLSVFRKL
ncbi:hypothetical protein EYF80_016075 [Liparis tanakae]|uniref:Transmembrane protein n=1 Tax=Liparis tanakae TaxID=230148 RepID=A0A4Z2I8G3_9TELE|nr:hypothetical protein EYF80_016075 [Liparis tanakae]